MGDLENLGKCVELASLLVYDLQQITPLMRFGVAYDDASSGLRLVMYLTRYSPT